MYPTILILPTEDPSYKPSGNPTYLPSNIPTNIPSDKSSNKQSNVPSKIPSTIPSKVPSTMPTKIPSDFSSVIPSHDPTDSPVERMSTLRVVNTSSMRTQTESSSDFTTSLGGVDDSDGSLNDNDYSDTLTLMIILISFVFCTVVIILIIFFIGLTKKKQLEIQEKCIELEIMNNKLEDLNKNNNNNKQNSKAQGIDVNKFGLVSPTHPHAYTDGSNLQNIVNLRATSLRAVESVDTVVTVDAAAGKQVADDINGGNMHGNGGSGGNDGRGIRNHGVHAQYTSRDTDIEELFNMNDNLDTVDTSDHNQLQLTMGETQIQTATSHSIGENDHDSTSTSDDIHDDDDHDDIHSDAIISDSHIDIDLNQLKLIDEQSLIMALNGPGHGQNKYNYNVKNKEKGEIAHDDDHGIEIDELNYRQWSQKEVMMWTKVNLTNNGIDNKKIQSFLKEWKKLYVTGAILNTLKNDDDALNVIMSKCDENKAQLVFGYL